MGFLIVGGWLGSVALGLALGLLVHEAGHLAAALATGIRPRVLMLGRGPTVARLRRRSFSVVLRALPDGGLVVAEPTDRRWAGMAMTAGGPLANLVALALCVWAPPLGTGLDLTTVALFQGVYAALALLPLPQTVAGLDVGSDGLQLLRALWRGPRPTVAARHAALLSSVGPVEDGADVSTPLAARVLLEHHLLHAARGVRTGPETLATMRELLAGPGLVRRERALVLCQMCALDGLYGRAITAPGEVDAWSREAMALAAGPMARHTRGEVLLRLGRAAEAEAPLRAAFADYIARGQGDGPQATACRSQLTKMLVAAGRGGDAKALWPAGETRAATPSGSALPGVLPGILADIRGRAYGDAGAPPPHGRPHDSGPATEAVP